MYKPTDFCLEFYLPCIPIVEMWIASNCQCSVYTHHVLYEYCLLSATAGPVACNSYSFKETDIKEQHTQKTTQCSKQRWMKLHKTKLTYSAVTKRESGDSCMLQYKWFSWSIRAITNSSFMVGCLNWRKWTIGVFKIFQNPCICVFYVL